MGPIYRQEYPIWAPSLLVEGSHVGFPYMYGGGESYCGSLLQVGPMWAPLSQLAPKFANLSVAIGWSNQLPVV